MARTPREPAVRTRRSELSGGPPRSEEKVRATARKAAEPKPGPAEGKAPGVVVLSDGIAQRQLSLYIPAELNDRLEEDLWAIQSHERRKVSKAQAVREALDLWLDTKEAERAKG